MHRRQIEAMKRDEKEAGARVLAAAQADPFDPARHKKALLEWQSARIALRSLGIRVPDPGPTATRTNRASKAAKADGDEAGKKTDNPG